MPDQSAADDKAISRRRALQAAVGTGVAAAAWNAPRIDGISIRPDYAAAQTGAPAGTVDAFQAVIGRSCNNANSIDYSAGLPGVTLNVVKELCQSGKFFNWSITPSNCTVEGMYCTAAAATSGTMADWTAGFVPGSGQSDTMTRTCYDPSIMNPDPQVEGLWIDVVCT